jgi:L-asparaginase
VIITGAMRPLSALGTDAEINLIDAIRLAINPESIGRGVLTVFNNEIHSARDVTKTNTLRIDAFSSRDKGILGYIDSDGKVVIYRDITRAHTTKTPFDIVGKQALPRVEIVYSYSGADGILLNSINQNKTDGLIIVGFGAGSFPSDFLLAADQIVQSGLPVVLASRAIIGRVITTPKKEAAGFIVADDLLPQKARILLMLSLTITHDSRSIQNLFYQY